MSATVNMWKKRLKALKAPTGFMAPVWKVLKFVVGIPLALVSALLVPYKSILDDFEGDTLWSVICFAAITFIYGLAFFFVYTVYQKEYADKKTVSLETVLKYKQTDQCVFEDLRILNDRGVIITGKILRISVRECKERQLVNNSRDGYKAAFE